MMKCCDIIWKMPYLQFFGLLIFVFAFQFFYLALINQFSYITFVLESEKDDY